MINTATWTKNVTCESSGFGSLRSNHTLNTVKPRDATITNAKKA